MTDFMPSDFDGNQGQRVMLSNLDLDLIDRCAARRHYRILRIAMYAPQSYTGPDHPCSQGHYGMSRSEAKEFIWNFYSEVSWLTYLGSK